MKTEVSDRTAPSGGGLTQWGPPAVASLIWLVVVVVWGLGARVLDNWESAATMAFGSFLAGSSPEGGSAVAFPVFTKGLHVSAPVARSFGLCIQAVGMSMAVAAVLLAGRRFHRRAAFVASVAAVAGFVVSVLVFGRRGDVFWPSRIGAAWVKATFSILLATTSLLMLRHLVVDRRRTEPLTWNRRFEVGLVFVALVGGFLSSLTGTGANIVVFLFLVVLAGVNPKEALPTAIIVMATVSIVGFVLYGLADGQLDVEVAGSRVVAVGDQAADLAAQEADLTGLWLAAVPIVVWGAPLGSWVASLVHEHVLVRFVAVLAAAEVVTTFVLVPELRSSPALLGYLIIGLVGFPLAWIVLAHRRRAVFATG